MSLKKFKKKTRKRLRKVMRFVRRIITRISKVVYRNMYQKIKVDDKTVIFISFHGRGYSDNPKAIHQYLMNHPKYKNYTFVWAVKKFKITKIPNAKIVRYNGLKYFYYMSKAKYWIINCKMPKHIIKKDNQIYLQTWHGTPLKRLAHDIVRPKDKEITYYRSGMNFDQMASTYDNDVSKYNYMISPNAFSTKVFQSAFRINRERLIETGYPRNDYLTNVSAEEVQALKEKYNIPEGKKVLLYAPTWRDNSYTERGYTFELQADFHKWKEVLGEEYVLLYKPHYLIINKYKKDEELREFLRNVRAGRDINELYVIADVLVTDYSSVFFDYANLKRPMYFYMFDLQEYAEELRGFYFDIHKTLPGDIIQDEDELLAKIKAGNYDYSRLESFNKEFNNLQDGHASDRVVDIVFE
ncbi:MULTISPECIES: CDP-glycerol glycerophosphotransferase family protein [unclassified Breznakia]|uniref:CDP-glycerol glycerophosphotransferase family protein n=1 Tax=unclassified Breznakia TaxID=2623764 RepID=UPI00247395FC|nr:MULTISPECIES: CDP-glycerol glycerophosphotransferase family protein [unclassified Breznakia]MDH6367808.1 CDP-glycerol glycerophosphotransferase [Breznakia sp. PH1-1]MDH6404895.1 CDP-glycerol glycerophosphotransferase [Breznakia sp. PF1-11]MDH6412611.1 CDP-glycerol glycerophosphotransferase [Breznakia sp. PFB1-11]MDH6414970.1 CDP-glycerol glycerophosphotransferase [Breznakia sp. PFB1-14]MDH6417281.1 CDP-glycerol glycerophosphotransferase [Breznakia sp. PFB1-4]